jgi:hypothetical protein
VARPTASGWKEEMPVGLRGRHRCRARSVDPAIAIRHHCRDGSAPRDGLRTSSPLVSRESLGLGVSGRGVSGVWFTEPHVPAARPCNNGPTPPPCSTKPFNRLRSSGSVEESPTPTLFTGAGGEGLVDEPTGQSHGPGTDLFGTYH